MNVLTSAWNKFKYKIATSDLSPPKEVLKELTKLNWQFRTVTEIGPWPGMAQCWTIVKTPEGNTIDNSASSDYERYRQAKKIIADNLYISIPSHIS